MIIFDEVYPLCHSITPTRDSLAFTSVAHVAGPTNASLRHIPLSAAKAPIVTVNLGIHCYRCGVSGADLPLNHPKK